MKVWVGRAEEAVEALVEVLAPTEAQGARIVVEELGDEYLHAHREMEGDGGR